MGLNEKGLNVAKFGAVFFAKQSTSCLQAGKVLDFTIEGTPPTGWTNAGYLSLETLPDPGLDGGDQQSLGTYQRRNTSSLTNDATVSLSLTGVQTDAQTLDMFNDLRKAGVPISVFILTMGPDGERIGEWWPTGTFSLTGLPKPSTTGYSTITYKVTQGSPKEDIKLSDIKKTVNPATAVAEVFDALYFDDAAFALAA